MLGSRNIKGLTEREIEYCLQAYDYLNGNLICPLDVSEATTPGTSTRFNESRRVVFLGANVLPGTALDANSRLSALACLAHEIAHCERYDLGYNRPTYKESRDYLIDEAETSLRASFNLALSLKEREDLISDARDSLDE